MKKIYKKILVSFVFFTIVSNANSQSSAIYNSTNSGTLSGIPFTFSGLQGSTIANYNYTGANYSPLQLSSSQPSFVYGANENWILTFSSPIQSLKLYCKYWRTSQVQFDQPFTIISGNYLVNPSGNLLNTTAYSDGIIEFNNPITTLSLTVIVSTPGAICLTLADGPSLKTDDFNFNNNQIKLYPIPSDNFINIKGLSQPQNYRIYDILGTEISSGTISDDTEIDIKNLLNGFYFLKLEVEGTVRFIKK